MTRRLAALPPRIGQADTRRVRPPPKVAAPFYSTPEWRQLLANIIRERGRRCEDPKHDPAQPRGGRQIYGDHVIELKDGGAALDPRNVMLRCASCHGRKTVAARAKRARS
jgi:hypothetical protein